MFLRRPQLFKEQDVEKKLFYENLYKLVSGNISFGSSVNAVDKSQNIQGFMAEVLDSGLANTSVAITHNLGYIPKFYDVKYLNHASQIFDFGTPWTKTMIYLASTTAHTKFRVFIH